MLETKEQETSPVEENHQLPQEVNKYHKRIDDLIEDAEIEAEMEAEKKIRSKNSRMFSISVMGLGLLGLVYFQVNHQTSTKPVETAMKPELKKAETAEESLAKQVPVVKDAASGSSLPISELASTTKAVIGSNPFLKSTEPSPPKAKSKETKKVPTINKVAKVSKPKATPKKTITATKINKPGFFIQAGAFGDNKNAESLLKQLKSKGFAPSIQTRTKKLNQHVVTVGNFSQQKAGETKLKELTDKGFKASIYKNTNKTFSLKVGQFNNLKAAQKLQDSLSLKGFLSKTHKADLPSKTYIVQMGVFPNREKALLTQEKLARAGHPKTFIR